MSEKPMPRLFRLFRDFAGRIVFLAARGKLIDSIRRTGC